MAAALPAGDERTWLGAFGEQWFRLLCVTAACTPVKLDPDTVGTDFLVQDQYSEVIRVQVKTTEHPHETSTGFTHDLDVATYDKLRMGSTPGYLVLVVLHAPYPRWTGHTRAGSLVRASVYWAGLGGLPATPNESTVRVFLPLGNMLTPAKLPGLFPGGGE